jgi:hypothetical protein
MKQALLSSPVLRALSMTRWTTKVSDGVYSVSDHGNYALRGMYEVLLRSTIARCATRISAPVAANALASAIPNYTLSGPPCTVGHVILSLIRSGSTTIGLAPECAAQLAVPGAAHSSGGGRAKECQLYVLHVSRRDARSVSPSKVGDGVIVMGSAPGQMKHILQCAEFLLFGRGGGKAPDQQCTMQPIDRLTTRYLQEFETIDKAHSVQYITDPVIVGKFNTALQHMKPVQIGDRAYRTLHVATLADFVGWSTDLGAAAGPILLKRYLRCAAKYESEMVFEIPTPLALDGTRSVHPRDVEGCANWMHSKMSAESECFLIDGGNILFAVSSLDAQTRRRDRERRRHT